MVTCFLTFVHMYTHKHTHAHLNCIDVFVSAVDLRSKYSLLLTTSLHIQCNVVVNYCYCWHSYCYFFCFCWFCCCSAAAAAAIACIYRFNALLFFVIILSISIFIDDAVTATAADAVGAKRLDSRLVDVVEINGLFSVACEWWIWNLIR